MDIDDSPLEFGLMAASMNGWMDQVQAFVDHGADVNTSLNSESRTPLMFAAQNGHEDIVRYLIDHGADVNAVDTNGKTAAFGAAIRGHEGIAHLLASHLNASQSTISSRLASAQGQSPQLPTKWLITPFEVALQSLIDREGAGMQFRAKWLDADVVVKLFISDESITSFADQVKVWQQLRHPNVIKLYGACNVGHYFFVSEFASNGTLVDHLAACRRSGTEYTPWKFLHEAALGLAYLHERNIVHGNLRGSNILIGSDGLAKLSEFALSGPTGARVWSGVFGLTRWQAPEHVDNGQASFASDVYSLGLCIVEALSGKIPWIDEPNCRDIPKKSAWDPADIAHTDDAPGSLSDEVADLVSRMCGRDPKKRVAASVAAQMLERLAAQERAEHQVIRPLQPKSSLSIDKYMNGQLTRQWTKVQAKTPMNHADNLHRRVFEEVQVMYEKLGESPRSWKLFEQFHKLLVEIESMMQPDSFQNRIQRLSATRATGFAMKGLRHRLDVIWSMMKDSPAELEAFQCQWREQQGKHQELFISEDDQKLLVLRELNTEEDQSALLRILESEIEDHCSDYTPGQLAVLVTAHFDLLERNKSDVVTTTPEWFLPWHELEINIFDCVGTGGFGGVYRARWLESDVVVKLLDQGDSASRSEDSTFTSCSSLSISSPAIAAPVNREEKKKKREMFAREVGVWFGLSHPHIARLFGACHIGTLFFACEFASKGSLDAYLRKHPDELWQKLHEAALGVQYLHARGIVHGDIKCNNILVGDDGKAKVTDFGLSSDANQLNKADAQVSGASHWVAPECLEHGASKLSAASDVYSLGMCVVEALRIMEVVTSSVEQPMQYPLPWGDLPNAAVKHHVVRAKILPPRPKICSDDEWELVTRMCRSEPSDRLKISTVVDELASLASAKVSATTELTTVDYEEPTKRTPVLKTTSPAGASTLGLTDSLQDGTLPPSNAAASTTTVNVEPVLEVIEQMQTILRLTESKQSMTSAVGVPALIESLVAVSTLRAELLMGDFTRDSDEEQQSAVPSSAVEETPRRIIGYNRAVTSLMQACTKLASNNNHKLLNQIFGLLWDRFDHLSSVITINGDNLESLRSLVERAKESTKMLPEVKDTLIEFTKTAMQGYALHRDLDKLIDAKFWCVSTDGGEVHEWQSCCEEFLSAVDGSAGADERPTELDCTIS